MTRLDSIYTVKKDHFSPSIFRAHIAPDYVPEPSLVRKMTLPPRLQAVVSIRYWTDSYLGLRLWLSVFAQHICDE